MEEAALRERIEQLVAEEHRLLEEHRQGFDSRRHARLETIKGELDQAWDLLRRREAGQLEPLADADVPDPPNDLDGPDPEPRHLDHGVHTDGPQPEPGEGPRAL